MKNYGLKKREKRLLGKGGYSEVYLTLNPYSGRPVAQKVFKIKLNDKQVQDFRKEIIATVSCSHKNLVPILGNCMDPLLIDMEYEEGGDLTSLLKNNPNLPLKFKFHLMKEFLEGLKYLHDNRDIIHNNIKTNNIFLDKKYEGEGKPYPTLKISDFGLTLGLSGFTSKWTAPELLNNFYGKKPVMKSKASDIFSAGMVLYAIISQKEPFEDIENEAADKLIMKATIPNLDKIDCDIRIKQLISCSLRYEPFDQKNPENSRIQSISKLLEELLMIEEDLFC